MHQIPRLLFVLALLLAPVLLSAQERGRASLIVRLRSGLDAKGERGLQSIVERASGSALALSSIAKGGGARQVAHAAAGLDRYRVLVCDSAALPAVRAALAAAPEVELVLVNHRYHIDAAPNDSLYSEQWALATVDAERAWEITLGDSSIIIGVLDTGIDFLHPDLRDALAINRAEDVNGNGVFDDADLDGIDQDGNGLVDDVIGYDFVDQTYANLGDWTGRDPVPGDDQGHGTGVAGVIAATRNNRVGVAGLAPGCRILALRAFDATGNAEDDDIASAIIYAADRGVRVLNLSFGDYYASPLLGDAIRYAQSRGVLVVASAGNEGVDIPHFPADFPGVMEVGATSRADNISSFSNFGPMTSMSAPGSSILTTKAGGGYQTQSGTSFSSPYVAAAAGLILSIHPEWSAEQVRTALELSAEDRGRKGWDEYHGSGRLNVLRALRYPAPSQVSITRPAYDVALVLRGRNAITGSAFASLPFHWRLEYARDEAQPVWQAVTTASEQGVIDDTLGVLDADDLTPGSYVLRLVLEQENGGVAERRVPFAVGGAPPRIDSFMVDTVWRFDRRAVAVTVATDVPTRCVLHVRERGTAQPWRALALEPERSGWTRRQVLFLSDADLLADVVYEAYAVIESPGGDTAMVGSSPAPLLLARPSEAFAASGATIYSYTLPSGYLMREGVVNPGNGERMTAINRYRDGGDYGDLVVYAWRGGGFVPVDSTPQQWTPRDFGDADGDGRLELLGQAFDGGIVYGQTSRDGSPLASVRFADTTSGTFIPAALADLDGDGRDEVIARTMNAVGAPAEWRVLKLDGGTLRTTARIANRTQPPSDGTNSYGSPVVAVGDFDGDQRRDLLIADEDADAQIERGHGDGTFEPAWKVEQVGDGGSEFVAAADLNGDGRDEAIVAWHSRTYGSPGIPFQPPFWTVTVYTFDEAMNARVLWSDRFAYVRPTVPFRSYVAAANLDGTPGSELALLLFPNFYILRWDSAEERMVPVFWRGNAIGNAPAVADYNGDGTSEIAVSDGARVRFLQLDPRRALLAPGAVEAWSTGDSSAHAEWGTVAGASSYTVYRGILPEGGGGSVVLAPIATLTGTSIEDTGIATAEQRLLSGRTYAYVVRATAGSEESALSGAALATIHRQVRPVAVQPVHSRSFVVRFSGEMGAVLRRPGALDLRDGSEAPRAISTIVDAADSALLVTLTHAATAPDTLHLRATSLLRDLYNSPVDTSIVLELVLAPPAEPGGYFIATRAEVISATEIAILFNDPVDPATLMPDAFSLAPRGHVLSVVIDPANPRRVVLALDPAEPLAVNGRYVTITVTGVRDLSGREVGGGRGSTVALVLVGDESFALVRALPQPFSRARDERLTFVGLPRGARLAIHTLTGSPIRQLDERDGTGSIEWDARDEEGRTVPSGVYLYEVQSEGGSTSSGPRKFVVLP